MNKVIACLLTLLVLSGCESPLEILQGFKPKPRAKQSANASGSTVKFPNTRPGLILDTATAPYTGLRTLECQAALKAEDAEETYRFNVHMLLENPGNLHIAASKAMGIEAFELSMRGELIDIWLPRKSTLYKGRVSDLAEGDLDFHPDEIVGQILLSRADIAKKRWNVESEKDGIITLTSGRRDVEKILVNTESGEMVGREIYRHGSCLMSVKFERYKPTKDENGPELPHKITLNFPQENRELTLAVRKAWANPALSANDFTIAVPEKGVKEKSLKSASDSGAEMELREALEDPKEQ